ncbi:hypothetical protein RV11_GL002998 [Enterococcus phoeniculicola]|jgi:putative redox protein|uniref:OsmC-like protein n=1 Tax=Enterococcus phoeniculicola ATCC BAA-412 TaxID=1158610 RepID=R3WLC6_9ENTE|nr:OsmC family protein [Enterococcus phoeniculicola]EOL42675.1 hypothetical protein UC3_03028 [Enterococcus phoeniculicola ATCC BAA-412]EOT79041.1 hypothetical protein I589_00548 [Enterococcus phoeniculicola ATCC BAA-412]OJG72416.1 hypothetical protein RV11_GL002998 [Enterococcus phoeniculicola]
MIERHLDLNEHEGKMRGTTRKNVNISFGSDEDQASPVELLVMSISGCSYGVLRIILENRKITYDSIHVDVDYLMEDAKPNKVTEVAIHFKIKNPSTDIDTLGRVLQQTIKSCTVIQSVKEAIQVNERITIIE